MEANVNFEKHVDEQLVKLEQQIKVYQELKLLLNSQALKGENSATIISPKKYLSSEESSFVLDENYKDYPLKGKFPEKIMYLNRKHPKAWKSIEIEEKIKSIEGEKYAKKTLKNVSAQLQNVRRRGIMVVAKYNGNNKLCFYILPEWRTEDGREIKAEHAPSPEFLSHLSEEEKGPDKIEWLTK